MKDKATNNDLVIKLHLYTIFWSSCSRHTLHRLGNSNVAFINTSNFDHRSVTNYIFLELRKVLKLDRETSWKSNLTNYNYIKINDKIEICLLW